MTEKSIGAGRVKYVDIAKGIAMICIILGHLGNMDISKVVFTFHVPIFFFITGYFTNNKKSVKDFIKSKLRALIVPYIVTCIVIIILGTIEGWIKGDALSALKEWSFASLYGAGDAYTEPFYIPAIGALWFLWATFWGSIFLRISLNFHKYLRIAFVAALFLAGYFSRSICWFPLSIQVGACSTLFMYMGYLLKDIKPVVDGLSKEIKAFGIIFAAVVWFFFMKDFQTFWFVHCDIGRGIVDVFGCMCACLVVMCISRLIELKLKPVGDFFAYFGKYSLLVLCVHIIELNLFPWWQLAGKVVALGMPESCRLAFIIVAKLIADLLCVFILSKISFVRKLFGIKN